VLDLKVTVATRSGKKVTRKVKVYLLGRRYASAASGDKAVTIRVRLTRSGKKHLRRVKPKTVRFTLIAKDKAGNATKSARTIRVLRR